MNKADFEAKKAAMVEKHGCRDCKFNCPCDEFWTMPCPDYIKKEEAK